MSARLEVIVGPMFSGKTEELIRRVKRAQWARKNVLLVKPLRDTRTPHIAARSIVGGTSTVTETMLARPIMAIEDLLMDMEEVRPDVLGADEAQFFKPWFVDAVQFLLRGHASTDFRIIVSGLDLTYARVPFGPMPDLLAIADEVTKLTGVCMKCGADGARFTQRTAGSTDEIQVGDKDTYEVRCRSCHYIFDAQEPR